MNPSKTLSFDFEITKKSGSGITIEGYANAATVDRMKERISPQGWQLENYKKNPVVLFDHGHDPSFGFMPIGKAVAIEAKEDGLYTKIQLSNSKNEKISAVRDLVEEGILKTFSVGFNPLDMTKAADDPEVTQITKAELIETSIVPIPMNQDSMFSLVGKRFAKKIHPAAAKWFEAYCGKVSLAKKGAWVAAALHQRVTDLIQLGEVKGFEDVVKDVVKSSGATVEQVKGVVSGEITPVPETILVAFAERLKINAAILKNIDGADMTIFDKVRVEATNEEPMKKKSDDVKTKGEAVPTLVVQSIMVPKDAYDTLELAITAVSAAGYNTDLAKEADGMYVFDQVEESGVDMAKASSVDLGAGIIAKVAPTVAEKAVEEPKENEKPDEAKAAQVEDEKPKEEGKQDKEVDGEKLKTDFAAHVEGALAEWKKDEAMWAKAVAASNAVLGKEDFGFLSWWYSTQAKSNDQAKGAGDVSTKGVDQIDDNPYLQEARQTNVLLGTLVNELKVLAASLKGESVDEDKPKDEAGGKDEVEDDEAMKSILDNVYHYKRLLKEKLDGLSV